MGGMAKTPSTSSRSRKDRPSNVVPMVRSRAAADEAPAAPPAVDPAERQRWIAERAYLLAEQRGFAPGGELADWLAAEREVDAKLRATT